MYLLHLWQYDPILDNLCVFCIPIIIHRANKICDVHCVHHEEEDDKEWILKNFYHVENER